MKILFYVSKLYSLPVIQPLLFQAIKREVTVALYVSSKVERNIPEAFSGVKIFTELNQAIAFNPDFVLCPGNFVDFRLPGIKVELFHGIGIEKPSHYKIRHFFDIYFTSGPVVTKKFKKMQKKYKYFKVIETGWPKIDHIVGYNTTDIRKRFKIPENKKVILYAPTHSSSMESASEILSSIDSIQRSDEIWFCKPHEFMKKELLLKLKMMNIRLISSYDITPYLHIADVMISDTSSVIYEFLILDKPVITYRTLSRKSKGINIDSPSQLRTAIDRSLNNPEEFSSLRQEHIKAVNPLVDGTICLKIISQLKLWHETPFAKGKKPLNLFRKMQIIYHGKFKKGYLR